jgi:hypothetical protein
MTLGDERAESAGHPGQLVDVRAARHCERS